MKLLLLVLAIIFFVLVAILCFIGGVTLLHLLAFGFIGLAAFAASFLPIP